MKFKDIEVSGIEHIVFLTPTKSTQWTRHEDSWKKQIFRLECDPAIPLPVPKTDRRMMKAIKFLQTLRSIRMWVQVRTQSLFVEFTSSKSFDWDEQASTITGWTHVTSISDP